MGVWGLRVVFVFRIQGLGWFRVVGLSLVFW